jgi:preprotein translocase subunit SecE
MSRLTHYLAEVKAELQKVNWPWDLQEKGFKRFRELSDSTLVILFATIILGAFVSFWDFVMQGVMKVLTIL